jgi:chemotaxis regulatin CheY-phosphate phosphatase CheZ
LKLEREKSEKKALESFELVSKVSACEKIIERLEGDASKMKKNWDSFLQDD